MKTTRMDQWCANKARELVHAAGALIAHGHPRGVGKVEDALRAAFERGAGVIEVGDIAGDGEDYAAPPDLANAIEVRFVGHLGHPPGPPPELPPWAAPAAPPDPPESPPPEPTPEEPMPPRGRRPR